MSEYTAEQRAADNERWLTQRLGNVTDTVRNIVRTLVCDGPWSLESASEWRIELVRREYDGTRHTSTTLIIWLQYSKASARWFGRAETWTSERTAWNQRLADVLAVVDAWAGVA